MELEGELPERSAKEVRAHLQACWQCRARRQELERSISDFIQAYQQEIPSAAGPRALLKARLAQEASARRQAGRWFGLRNKYAWAGGISVLGLAVAAWFAAVPARWDGSRRTIGDLALSTPDRVLTPGATVLLSRSAVCSLANVKNKDVPASVQKIVFAEYGIAKAPARAYEVDYLVTPALGGSDDIRNLWPHSYFSIWNAHVKDALEDRLRDMVCKGDLDLAVAQREIAGNWIEAYKRRFHADLPLPEHTR